MGRWLLGGSWYNKKNQGSEVDAVDGYLGLFGDYVEALDDALKDHDALEYSAAPSPPTTTTLKASL